MSYLWDIAKLLLSAGGVLVVVYLKEISSSMKDMKRAIDEIKLSINTHDVNYQNMRKEVDELKQEQKEQVKAAVSFWNKYGGHLQKINGEEPAI